MTSSDLEHLIRNRFAPPLYAFLPQVRNGTGFVKDARTADALAMCLYPSRGLDMNGFEIKVNRGDWLVELKNPDKADDIAYYCDFWWIVAPKDIVKIEELPATWGLMNPFGATLKIVKKAERLKSNPLDKIFVAAVLRRTMECLTGEAKLKAEYRRGKDDGQKRTNELFEFERNNHRELESEIKKFEEASGINIRHVWDREKIGEAVRTVLNGQHLHIKEALNGLQTTAERIVERIKEELINVK